MKSDLIQSLTEDLEGHAQQTEGGVEYWLARDLQHLLGYAEWRNFNQSAVTKAKTACEVSGHAVTDHFVDVNKMIWIGAPSCSRWLIAATPLDANDPDSRNPAGVPAIVHASGRFSEHHFVGVNKMVPAGHSERCAGIEAEARALEAKIAENVEDLSEA